MDAGGDLIPRQAAKGLTKAIGSFKSFLLVSREQKFVALSRVSSKLITVKLLSPEQLTRHLSVPESRSDRGINR